jgi:hypothetical protein
MRLRARAPCQWPVLGCLDLYTSVRWPTTCNKLICEAEPRYAVVHGDPLDGGVLRIETHSEEAMRSFRMGLTIVLAMYGGAILVTPDHWSLLDGLNQAVHATGHLLLVGTNETMQQLGGTVLQLLLPLIVTAYFTVRDDEHAASIGVWWVGQNAVNISASMAISGTGSTGSVPGSVEHDWLMLFARWDVLHHAEQYANLTRGFGVLLMLLATMWGLFRAADQRRRVRWVPTQASIRGPRSPRRGA